jgi:hypothetical protein
VKEFKENASKEKSQESKLLEQKESDSVSSKPNEFKLGKAENFIWLVSKVFIAIFIPFSFTFW